MSIHKFKKSISIILILILTSTITSCNAANLVAVNESKAIVPTLTPVHNNKTNFQKNPSGSSNTDNKVQEIADADSGSTPTETNNKVIWYDIGILTGMASGIGLIIGGLCKMTVANINRVQQNRHQLNNIIP